MTCSYRNLWRDEKAFLSFITPRGSYFFSLNHFSPFTNSYFYTAIFFYEALHYNVKHLIFPIFSFAAKRFEKKCNQIKKIILNKRGSERYEVKNDPLTFFFINLIIY